MTDIPTIDFAAHYTGLQEDKERLGQELVTSLRIFGIAKLVNHGVPVPVLQSGFDISRRFFTMPYAAKEVAAHPKRPNPHRGWSCIGLEKIGGLTGFAHGNPIIEKPVEDVKESYDMGDRHDPLYPNQWPSDADLPEFRPFMEDFFDTCHDAMQDVLSVLAESLGIDRRILDELHTSKNHELRLLHYPAVESSVLDDKSKTRIAEHTDFGSITLLFQDEVGGLEVKEQTGSRFDEVLAAAPTMIVNIGDAMERWTNSNLRAAVHRVTKPSASSSPIDPIGARMQTTIPERYSIAFFGKPNREASLKPFDVFVSEDRPSLFPDMTAHEHNQAKLVRTF